MTGSEIVLARPVSVPVRSRQGRRILVATVLGAGIAGIDASVVNVALPEIGRDLGASFASLQWTVTGYTLSLASLILLAGALGDRYGRRRIFLAGVAVFTFASVLCAAVPDVGSLVGARILQGVGGALMAPASMAILQATIAPGDRPAAIGTWSGFAGIAGALAPFAGGWLLSLGSWRWIFLINVPVAIVVLVISLRHLPETRDDGSSGMDWGGSALAFASLAAVTYALTVLPADPSRPWGLVSAVVAVGAGGGFAWYERRTTSPMLPATLTKSRPFVTINVITFVIYGAFGVFSVIFTIALETVAGYSPAEAGSTLLPITVLGLALSRFSGRLAARIGPGPQLAIGPVLCGTAALLTLRVGPETGYWSVAVPLECVFGLGTATMVAPLTSVALSSLPGGHVGVASAVNNTVARAAGLVWLAGLPPLVGLTGDSYTQAEAFLRGYRPACVICAVAMFVSGAIAAAVGLPKIDRGEGGSHDNV
ncbi:drug resistance transporter, EmrB/QacA subfamily [Amycolatopsis pretoriensis]|uniref:Drug resistance transporter, EmrB/QacA subfamily n=1 Tax=Amycolatopsis pretoriensis TaxID=218821 RepID=A0A1H5Q3I3_9PSEU|nr:MFS transporter [Amycolatopsis pretoriensis]SEF20636.1 drug resistance transporter, EmrB/QacA subfamily [Amycolatopsis pretoriensis]